MDAKQHKFYSGLYSKSIIDKVAAFLNENKYSLFNLAPLGDDDWRVMYRDTNDKVQSQIFHWPI